LVNGKRRASIPLFRNWRWDEAFAERAAHDPLRRVLAGWDPYFTAAMTEREEQLLALLAQHDSLGNGKAREHLGWDEDTYNLAKEGLYAQGLVAFGRGRGGTIRLAAPSGPAAGGAVASEPMGQSANGLPAAHHEALRSGATQPMPVPYPTAKRGPGRPPKAQSQEANKPQAQKPQALSPEANPSTSLRTGRKAPKPTTTEPIEKQLWKTADKLRKNIDAAEYKHIVLGLVFLKYISDAFVEHYDKLKDGKGEYAGADPEDKDEYKAENVFFVPPSARWSFLQSHAKQPTIGKTVDEAMDAIERENDSLKGVLPKVYARQNLDPTSLGGLIDLIGNIALGDAKSRNADVLGHVFEYFLGEFALAEGKKGGQFYTPRSVVELLVKMLEPYKGRVFDPCCGSGGMFVQSEKFITEH
jgi:hypothetical protein